MEDLSDIERAEQVRTFVRENLWFALLALALGVAAVTGFRYWQAKRTGGAEQAESEYSAVITALSCTTSAANASDRGPISPVPETSSRILPRCWLP